MGAETGNKEEQEKGATLFGRRSAHNCPQCGQFRAFGRTLFPAEKWACDAVVRNKSGKGPEIKAFP